MEIKQIAQQIIDKGRYLYASDIYILPIKDQYAISFRIHHRQFKLCQLTNDLANKLILYFKFLADMDVSERRKVQLGSCTIGDNRLRLSTVSDYLQRESLVIRFLNNCHKRLKYVANISLQELDQLLNYRGLHLFSGPVGSGKTTLMYHLARQKSAHSQVITIEDPVEIEQNDFLQLQVQKKINLTYDKLIKLCLRHRPDILIIGEIRDEETAKATIRAALTGHTILATVHAKSSNDVYERLENLGVSQFDMKQVIKSVTYQRILPCYCPFCQGSCELYCPHQKNNNRCFFETISPYISNNKRWNEVLRNAWLSGVITTSIYLQEKQVD